MWLWLLLVLLVLNHSLLLAECEPPKYKYYGLRRAEEK